MPKIIGVKFRSGGKSYYFDPGECEVVRGDHVVVETSRGVEYGTVSYDLGEQDEIESATPIKTILRKATAEDDDRASYNRQKESEAYALGKERIAAHNLEMKLIDVEYTFDNNKILFYFTADGRIDFRELVKDLASVFRTRIELRQIGVRDEAKILGGMGICGRPVCCHGYLGDFAPVSIKMAKVQGLSLNPTKISGTCGRLMCCLKNEEDVYEELSERMPNIGDCAVAADGVEGEVSAVSILKEQITVMVEENGERTLHTYSVNDILEFRKQKKDRNKNNTKEGETDDTDSKASETKRTYVKELQEKIAEAKALEEAHSERVAKEVEAAKTAKRNADRVNKGFENNSNRNRRNRKTEQPGAEGFAEKTYEDKRRNRHFDKRSPDRREYRQHTDMNRQRRNYRERKNFNQNKTPNKTE